MSKSFRANVFTISQAADKFGVSIQRMHQLIALYGVTTEQIHARLYTVTAKELKKIPDYRPSGVKISER